MSRRESNFVASALTDKLRKGLTVNEAKQEYEKKYNTIIDINVVKIHLARTCYLSNGIYYLS